MAVKKDVFYDDADKYWPNHIKLLDKPEWVFIPRYSFLYLESHIRESDPNITTESLSTADNCGYWSKKDWLANGINYVPENLKEHTNGNKILACTPCLTRIPKNILGQTIAAFGGPWEAVKKYNELGKMIAIFDAEIDD